jgi:hypothetical protein
MSLDQIQTRISGHVKIVDRITNDVVLDKKNAIHSRNLAIALARGLSNEPADTLNRGKYQIFKIKLGNGGTYINSSNEITYLAPNVTGSNSNLWSPTYEELVDRADVSTPSENSVTYQENPTPGSSVIIVVTATIGAGEPSGQLVSDTPGQLNSQFAFDELGLFTSDDLLLSHLVFAPILKTSTRELVLTYTLTLSVE